MKTIHLNQDLHYYWDDVDILVTNYEWDWLEWSWEAWTYEKWYKIEWIEYKPYSKYYLWHCSCHWPFEWQEPISYTEEEASKLMSEEMKIYFNL